MLRSARRRARELPGSAVASGRESPTPPLVPPRRAFGGLGAESAATISSSLTGTSSGVAPLAPAVDEDGELPRHLRVLVGATVSHRMAVCSTSNSGPSENTATRSAASLPFLDATLM